MKVLKLIVMGLICIMLSSVANAMVVHNEKIEPIWEPICTSEEDLKEKTAGHCEYGPADISDDYTFVTKSLYGERYLDQKCVETFDIETHSAGYIYAVCTREAVRSDAAYIQDSLGNTILDYSPGAGATTVFISDDYAALGSSNNLIHFFKLSDEGKWVVVWKYTTDGTPRSVYISDDAVYTGDNNNNVYSINKENGKLNWKFAVISPIIQVHGISGGIVAGSETGVYFIDEEGKLIKKQDIVGIVKAVHVEGDNVAVGAGSNIYLFDVNGNLKFNYNADNTVSDVKISASEGYVVAGAGENVYMLSLNGELKGKFAVAGIVDSVNIWGKYAGAGVIGEDSYNYLFDENGIADVRYGGESEQLGITVKSVINKGDYAVAVHTINYKKEGEEGEEVIYATNDKIKFYKLGFVRTKDLLLKAQFAVVDLEKVEADMGLDIADAKASLDESEKSFAENNYPETFRYARISEGMVIDKVEELIYDAERVINESKKGIIPVETTIAETQTLSAKNSLIRKEYANAVIYSENAKELINKLILAETEAEISDTKFLFTSVRDLEGFSELVDIPDIEREIGTSDTLLSEGKYEESVKRSNNSKNVILGGLNKYMEGLITNAEEKLDDSKGIGSALLQAEEISISEDNLDKAKKAFEEGRKGDWLKTFDVNKYAMAAEKSAENAKTRTIAGYLMGVVLLWAVLSALVIMIIKPKWPVIHYPGTEDIKEHKSKKKEKR